MESSCHSGWAAGPCRRPRGRGGAPGSRALGRRRRGPTRRRRPPSRATPAPCRPGTSGSSSATTTRTAKPATSARRRVETLHVPRPGNGADFGVAGGQRPSVHRAGCAGVRGLTEASWPVGGRRSRARGQPHAGLVARRPWVARQRRQVGSRLISSFTQTCAGGLDRARLMNRGAHLGSERPSRASWAICISCAVGWSRVSALRAGRSRPWRAVRAAGASANA